MYLLDSPQFLDARQKLFGGELRSSQLLAHLLADQLVQRLDVADLDAFGKHLTDGVAGCLLVVQLLALDSSSADLRVSRKCIFGVGPVALLERL